jgi:hypothetical protein
MSGQVTFKPRNRCQGCGQTTTRTDSSGNPECTRCAGTFRELSARVDWQPVITRAISIVESYDTGVTLRQLFYRLVAKLLLPNTPSYYQNLSKRTAIGRRDGTFPDLLDRVSRIEEFSFFASPEDAIAYVAGSYRRDRTEGQPWTIFLAVEKAGLSAQMDVWFTGPQGIPHVALGGYASQSLCDQVRRYVDDQSRPSVLLYAGDLDPTGDDIYRDFTERTDCWDTLTRVALERGQVEVHRLPRSVDPEVTAKLERDPRAAAFLARHGDLVQYEVDALAPDVLRQLFADAIAGYWDDGTYREVLGQEKNERHRLEAAQLPGGDS